MTTSETITAYRAAAAKLSEALADRHRTPAVACNLVAEAEELAGSHLSRPGEGIGYCNNYHSALSDVADGWRWITEAARLRLLVEALLLEQRERRIRIDWRDKSTQVRTEPPTCIGCGMPDGAYHGAGCDHERCGNCGMQRIMCDCDATEMVTLVRHWTGEAQP